MKVFFYCLVAMSLVGCANPLPKAELFPVTSQKKALTANHWSLIAQDAAQRTRMALAKQGYGAELPIYVAESANIDFDRAFRKYLIAHLIESGATVSTVSKDAIELKYESQIIKHSSAIDLQAYGYQPGMLVGGVAGVWILRDILRSGRSNEARAFGTIALAGAKELYDAYHTDPTPVELVLTTSITNQDKYLMLQADAYYIEKGEEKLFESQQMRECTKNIWCKKVK